MSKPKEENHIPVPIPAPLFYKIQKRVDETEFESVSDYVTYLLRQVLAETEEEESVFTKEEEEKIKQRLKALGYLE